MIPPNHPWQWYGQIWIWMAQAQLGDKAQADKELQGFVKSRKPAKDTRWPSNIVDFVLDRVDEANFLAGARASEPEALSRNMCEAWFYAAKREELAGDKQTAAKYFNECLATNMKDFSEYKAASIELQNINK